MFQSREPYLHNLMDLQPTKAYLITVEGSIEEISPSNGKEFQLEEVQRIVEGYIEVVYLNDRQIMIVNDSGKYNKAANVVATGIANLHRALWHGDYICGNTVICPSEMLP